MDPSSYQALPDAPSQPIAYPGFSGPYQPVPYGASINPEYNSPKHQQLAYPAAPVVSNLAPPHRVLEIDFELDHGHGFYKCWLWFMLGIMITELMLAALSISLEFGESETFVGIVVSIFYCYVYFLGITAPADRSLDKNKLFKNLIIGITILQFVGTIILTFDYLFGGSITKHKDEGKPGWGEAIIMIVVYWNIFFVQLVINTCLWCGARKIGNLLAERKQLLGGARGIQQA